MTFEDAETGEQIEIDTSKSSVRNAFAAEEEGRRKNLYKLFGSRGIDVVPLGTDKDYLVALRSVFRASGKKTGRRMMPPTPQATPAPIHDIAGPVWFFPYPPGWLWQPVSRFSPW